MTNWTEDDIRSINPEDALGQQSRSNLDYLLESGGANLSLLCEGAEHLEGKGSGTTLAYGLIPVTLNVPSEVFEVPTQSRSLPSIFLRFRPVAQYLKSNGSVQLLCSTDESTSSSDHEICQATLVVGELDLWGWRKEWYSRYLDCIKADGLSDRVIGKKRAHMNISPVAIDGGVTAKLFESELSRRIRDELVYGTTFFIKGYQIAQLEEVHNHDFLYSYFAMVAPGRISFGNTPLPLFCALRKFVPKRAASPLDVSRYRMAQGSITTHHDKTVRQLIAMARLVKEGEPELAVIGVASAMEFFLNEKFPDLVSRRNGVEFSSSIPKAVRDKRIKSRLDESIVTRLVDLGTTRNSLVHGEPKDRTLGMTSRSRIDAEYAFAMIDTCMIAYRLINLAS